jgi:hypothetical protein
MQLTKCTFTQNESDEVNFVSVSNFDAPQDDILREQQEPDILSQRGYGKWQTQTLGQSVLNQVMFWNSTNARTTTKIKRKV